ncbi:hypothetical protein NA57DRAFT_33791 [Rhizodiscina lignyota]|uniref:Zn(2)-C6 fungal-type domain-containing protein n=1 Tax=Rhizodiscina lignyota TaxID=1504668 RepID=A0A9P4ILK2_9PEZI|nr:hypothetical protein NA57DRAFT_33791 [Rhizodiscina lignyota]
MESPTEHERDVIPKIEEVEEEDELDQKPLPSPPDEEDMEHNDDQTLIKRPRGRPRKHPKEPPNSISKTLKGRSKTGCITCRRRKKKCDETKPACLHCQKNNVHCEGYPPKDYWQSGKQRAMKGRRFSIEKPKELPALIEGIETDLDWFFFDHFNLHVSRVLSLFTDKQNPWTQILLPMATAHRGLMHSLLCLSGSHLMAREPNPQFEERQFHHFDKAVNHLRTNGAMAVTVSGEKSALIDDPTIAQTLVLCLKSICAGELEGTYCPHLNAARHLVLSQKASNPEFQSFLFEFFIYHDVCNSVTKVDHRSVLMMDDFHLPQFMIQPEAGAFLGVVDGLFGCISRIRKLRDRIRERRTQGRQPYVDFTILNDAREIDVSIREWVCIQTPDTSRWIASMLYRQCTWIYLQRTVMPSTPSETINEAVEVGLQYLRELPSDSSTQSIMLMPTFLLGCAAFSPDHRPEIRSAFDQLQAYSNLGNIKYARQIVDCVWELMDSGDESSWDWEGIIQSKGWDFLIT